MVKQITAGRNDADMQNLKKYIPAVIAALCLVMAFAISFSAAKSAKLKKLHAGGAPQPAAQTTEADDTTAETPDTTAADPAPDTTAENAAPDTSEAAPGEDATENGGDLTALPEPATVNMPTDSGWSLVLLNIFYRMNDTYEPMVAAADGNIVLDERVAEAYKEMAAAAAADGVTLTLASGYVSPDRQERMFNKEVEQLVNGGLTREAAELKASFTVLPPRCSEANYGLSVDVGWIGDDFAASPICTWMRAHAAQYGFIERYPAGKEEITHFKASPWHWRFVGKEPAQYIKENGVTLEEYLGKVN